MATRVAAASALLAGAIGCLGAHAQTQAILEVVTVLTRRLPVTEASAHQHVQIFTREQLDAHPAPSVAEFLVRVAGLMVDRRSGGYGSLLLRGADPSHVAVLVDGVRQNDPLSPRGSAVDLNTLSLEDIERIEVLLGAPAVVHGESLSGVVQLFSRAATGEPRVRAGAEAGGRGTRTAWAGVGTASARMSASVRRDGESAGSPGNTHRSRNVGATLGPAESQLRTDVRLAHARSQDFPDDSGGEQYAVVRSLEHRSSSVAQAALQWRHEISEKSFLEAWLARLERDGHQQTPPVAPGVRDPFGLPRIEADTRYRRGEAQLAWTREDNDWAATAGAQHQRESGRFDSLLFVPIPVPAPFALNRDTVAVFGQVRKTWTSATLQVGLRLERISGLGTFSHPSASLQHRLPVEGSSVGVALSSASKPPSFYALGHPLVGNALLRAERSQQGEAYYALESSGTRRRVTAFKARFKDLVDFDTGPPPRPVNRALIDSRGIEVSWKQTWATSFATRVEATAMRVRAPDAGQPLRHRPDVQAATTADVDVARGWPRRLDRDCVARP